jgi:type II secretory pathway component PulC
LNGGTGKSKGGKPRGGDRYETDFKIESYKEVTITQPKQFTKQLVGVEFKFDDNVGLVYVYKIDESSLFYNTSLQEGDWILSVNDVNLRNPTRDCNFDARRVAAKTCLQAKESVSFVVLKDETTFKTKTFNLDNSISDLEWLK